MYICSDYEKHPWYRFESLPNGKWRYEIYDQKQDRLTEPARDVDILEMEKIIEDLIVGDGEEYGRLFHIELYGDGE